MVVYNNWFLQLASSTLFGFILRRFLGCRLVRSSHYRLGELLFLVEVGQNRPAAEQLDARLSPAAAAGDCGWWEPVFGHGQRMIPALVGRWSEAFFYLTYLYK